MATPTSPATSRARPLSPHLQIYKPQITSMLSILHRITGVALAVGSVLLAVWLAAAGSAPPLFNALNAFLGTWFGKFLLLGWSIALFYHLANGIRHLFWDAGYGFDLETMRISGKAVIVATIVMTALAWGAALVSLGGR
jgi:succinate dehydrogenase / fumarate reductase cytochrome b subunit